MDSTTKELHETIKHYFKPSKDYILCEFIESIKSSGGVYLPNPEKSIGHPIISIGENVEGLKEGEWVILQPGLNVNVMTLFDSKFFYARPYDVVSVVNMDYLKAEKEYKENKVKERKLKIVTN